MSTASGAGRSSTARGRTASGAVLRAYRPEVPRSSSYQPRAAAQVRDIVDRQLRSPARTEDDDLDGDLDGDLDDGLDDELPPGAGEGAVRPGAELRRRIADRLPPALRAARLRVGAPAAVGFVLVAVLVAGGLAVLAWRTWPDGAAAAAGTSVPARAEPVAATTGPLAAEPATTGPATTGPATTEPPAVVVHVAGRVSAPGLVTLPGGSRVADAVEAAGGATEDADLDRVNLARPLVDGEQVLVPAPGQDVAPPAGTAAPPGGPGGASSGPLDLNTATAADLDALPGVGEVLAARIVAWREENGRFSSVDELGEVQGIGPKVLDGVRDLVRA